MNGESLIKDQSIFSLVITLLINPYKQFLSTIYGSRWEKINIGHYCRASDISRGRGPAKFRYFREIPRNSPKKAKYREIRQK